MAAYRRGTSSGELLTGSGAGDVILGLAGADRLVGGAGADIIIGGPGADRMFGGAGDDIFVFRAGDLVSSGAGYPDHIIDFEGSGHAGGDSLRFEGFSAAATLQFDHFGADRERAGDHYVLNPNQHLQYYRVVDPADHSHDGLILVQTVGTDMLMASDYSFVSQAKNLAVIGTTVPHTYSVDDLHALPATTLTATYTSAGKPVTDTYTGVKLWDLLQSGGGIPVDATVKNDVLSHYVVAVGSDGYRVVFSAGELSPKFGNDSDLVAYSDTGGQLGPGGSQGETRTVVPGDAAGGRYVSNLSFIDVEAGPAHHAGPGGLSTSLTVSGAVLHSGTYDETALMHLTPTTVTATYQSGAQTVTDTYTGVSLWTLLQNAGLALDPAVKNDELGKYVIATGSDGYQVAFSLGELDPKFGGNASKPILVAYDDTGPQLDNGGTDGFARLVVPDDIAGGRYVSNLTSVAVYDAVHADAPPAGFHLLV